jgi:glutamyl-tRNA synthetase
MIKVRFAPSPTGFLHLGSARTALFNWLFARKNDGKMLLRVEDTDKVRSRSEYLEEILEDLEWLGLDWDGELIHQSGRFDVYRKRAEELLEQGKAYTEGEAVIYKVEKGRVIDLEDMIHGRISFNTDEIKDQVMIKSDGSPAYNFCCVVDDADMGITHIIRGDDHVSNTPKQLMFYEALGKEPPAFGHMPLMMGTDGAKLSKRHGGVSVEEYRKEGFLPESIVNYLMLLGWSPGEDREILSLTEAVELFDIRNMSDVQAKFDLQKLRWMNATYIMARSAGDLAEALRQHLLAAGKDIAALDAPAFEKVVELYKVRIKTLDEFYELTDFFFTDDYTVEEKGKRKYLEKEGNPANLALFADKLEELEVFSSDNIEAVCRELMEKKELKASQIIHPARMAISGKTRGAGLFEMIEVLGREKAVERMRKVPGG